MTPSAARRPGDVASAARILRTDVCSTISQASCLYHIHRLQTGREAPIHHPRFRLRIAPNSRAANAGLADFFGNSPNLHDVTGPWRHPADACGPNPFSFEELYREVGLHLIERDEQTAGRLR